MILRSWLQEQIRDKGFFIYHFETSWTSSGEDQENEEKQFLELQTPLGFCLLLEGFGTQNKRTQAGWQIDKRIRHYRNERQVVMFRSSTLSTFKQTKHGSHTALYFNSIDHYYSKYFRKFNKFKIWKLLNTLF